jgi:lipopolysaccharide export LptBFGC system permease protein LptF
VWFAVCTASVWLLGLHPLGQISAKNYSSSVRRSYDETSKNIWMNFPADAMLVFVKNFANSHLQGLYAFDMQNNDRLFAQEIHIKESAWDLQDVNVISEGKIENIPRLLINFDEKLVDGQSSVHYRCIDRCASLLHHNVSDDLIRMLSKPPKKHSIYQLYKLYEIQKYCRIELKLYEMELQRLLANCMQFILFALIAAIICFPINRYKTKTSVSIKIIIISITMRFVDNILESLAYSGVVPIHLASWAVVLIALCIAIAMLVWREA